MLLRAFGARIDDGVVIKPRVRVKLPWRLSVGAHAWIGEGVWIDNLTNVTIGAHACLSQEAYLCTCAKAIVGPGVTIGPGAVLGLGAVATSDLAPEVIFGAPPPEFRKTRPARV